VKLLRNVVILKLDGVPDRNGDFFDQTTKITCDYNDVPVVSQSGYSLGVAVVIKNINGSNDELLVDIKFFDDARGMHSMQPCFMGKCVSRVVNHVLEAKLTSVMISKENADSRIPTLGSYLGIAPEPAKSNSPDACSCERLLNGHEPDCNWKRKQYGQNKH